MRLSFAVALVVGLAFIASETPVDWALGGPSTAQAAPKKKKKVTKTKAPVAKKPTPVKEPEPAPASDLVPSTSFRGPTRIDFDDRLIQGQTNKSGAVYLFDRKETGITSMVKRRKSFRQLTLQTVYDR
ncbi:MAG: hypothetical protein H6730_03740 [Deltaproteobacteria bacterium]|nr:hypothetical protein [Deltaproteobacteria bacterium]